MALASDLGALLEQSEPLWPTEGALSQKNHRLWIRVLHPLLSETFSLTLNGAFRMHIFHDIISAGIAFTLHVQAKVAASLNADLCWYV